MLHQFRTLLLVSLLAASTIAAGCTNRVDPAEESTDQEGSEVRHAHRGPAFVVIDAALEQPDLSIEQREAIVHVRERLLDQRHRAETKNKLRASATAIVRSGTARSMPFDDAMKEAMHAVEQRVMATSDALEEVHAILHPEQRVAVADVVRQRVEQRYERHAKRHEHRGRFRKVASYLMLSVVQEQQLKQIRKEVVGDEGELRPSREEVEALVDAFEREDFGVALDGFRDSKLKQVRGRMVHVAGHADRALSVLTSDQRELLADLIEFGPGAVGIPER